jgi:UDP-galactopyranose mutase
MTYDYLIVGAGLYGATFAHQLHKAGKTCLVIDKRNHIGGNTYCKDIGGIQVHQYGAHIFHTNDKRIWDFVNSFVPFKPFINSPKAKYYHEVYNMPFNMHTFEQLWGVKTPEEAQQKLATETAPYKKTNPANLKEQALSMVGPTIFEKLIKHYTEKQWGKPCDELPAFLIKRVPLRYTYDNNYFNDSYQGIPVGGYNKLTEGLLKGVDVKLGVDFLVNRAYWLSMADRVIYTGKIDAYFDYCLGELQYRSLRFEHKEMFGVNDFQGNAVYNYTSPDVPYTRVVEHKHFEWKELGHTVVSYEYPQQYQRGGEAYYPVNDEVNNTLYNQYKRLADKENKVLFGGRLAEYKYYDMHQVVAAALHQSQKIISHDQ